MIDFDLTLFEPDAAKIKGAAVMEVKEASTLNSIEKANTDEKDEYLIDLSEADSELEYTLEINGKNTFPKGDIQMIKGKAKQGKTNTLLCIMTALLSGEFLVIKSKVKDCKLCYFATEEHRRSVKRIAKKVHRLCQWNPNINNDRYKVYSIRKKNSKERVKYIEQKVREEKPDVVFIDGVRDLLNDFNNISESNEIVSLLLCLSEECNCSIVSVLHTNKSNFDSSPRGHLGTEMQNKCSDVLEVSKDKNVFCVEETESRNIEVGKFAFTLNENGLPEYADVSVVEKTNERIETMRSRFSEVLQNGKVLSHTELRKEYRELSGYKEVTGNKHIDEALSIGIIEKDESGKYKLCEVTI